jgi:hypothetical protein
MGAHLYQRADNITTKQVSAYGVETGLKPWAESYSPFGALEFGHFETVKPGEILDF